MQQNTKESLNSFQSRIPLRIFVKLYSVVKLTIEVTSHQQGVVKWRHYHMESRKMEHFP